MEYQFVKDRRMLEYGLNGLHSDIFCFSTTRHGGYSGGNYASFNCNACCGDSETSVAQNRGLLCSLMPVRPRCLVIPQQVHRTEVRCIDGNVLLEDESERAVLLEGVDARVSSLPEVCLCISTADCVPILFFDTRLKIVAAAHAGWRGTVAGIAAKTLRVMADAYGTRGQDVAACIGPSISPDAFEVGDEVYEAFRSAGFRMDRIAFRRGKWHIDLWEANRMQLLDSGVLPENVELSGICTYNAPADFFSARRLGIRSGRILSGIMLLR